MAQTERGTQTTPGGVQVITSPDGRSTTITDNGKVTTITAPWSSGPAVVTVNGRPTTDARVINEVIARVAATSRTSNFTTGTIRVNGRPLTEPKLLVAGALVGGGATLVGMTVLYLVVAAIRRIVRRPAPAAPAAVAAPNVAPNVAPQVARLEQAVEGFALELERIGEAQRFAAKLLSERLPAAAPNGPLAKPREPGRVNTPH